jgi:uncharacterized membrane protein
MSILILAFLIGVIAGLRALTAPAVASWAAHLRWISLVGTPLAFLGSAITVAILSRCALGEIFNDKRPATPSRKIPPQFITRVVTVGFSGAAPGLCRQSLGLGLGAGAIGAVAGTLGGAFGNDLPAALLEDAIAISGGLLIVSLARLTAR